jgi:hypothetical protein
MSETYFDRLPIELIHEIFSYLSCHQIIQSFYSINNYMNNIIRNYDFFIWIFLRMKYEKKNLI